MTLLEIRTDTRWVQLNYSDIGDTASTLIWQKGSVCRVSVLIRRWMFIIICSDKRKFPFLGYWTMSNHQCHHFCVLLHKNVFVILLSPYACCCFLHSSQNGLAQTLNWKWNCYCRLPQLEKVEIPRLYNDSIKKSYMVTARNWKTRFILIMFISFYSYISVRTEGKFLSQFFVDIFVCSQWTRYRWLYRIELLPQSLSQKCCLKLWRSSVSLRKSHVSDGFYSHGSGGWDRLGWGGVDIVITAVCLSVAAITCTICCKGFTGFRSILAGCLRFGSGRSPLISIRWRSEGEVKVWAQR